MFTLIHNRGCGGMVIDMVERPPACSHIDHRNLRHLDGRLFSAHEMCQCETCGGYIGNDDLDSRYIVEYGGSLQ